MATPQTATFNKQLKQALKHYADPDRLAKESVLATAYFLGHAGSTEGEAHWGVLLRQLLLRAGHSLWGETAPQSRDEVEAAWQELLAAPGSLRYHYLVLELRYFQEFFRPRSLQQIWQEFLQQSRAEFYRDVDRAVEALAEALLTLLQPGARLEPLPRTEPLLGREALLERTRVALMAGQSVALRGASGAGKSSLAAQIAARWATPAVFWYTVRPELSDRLYPLLYALGAFFHRHGVSSLWRALAANQGRLDDVALLITLARRDLAALHDQHPLFVFDEVDLWPAGESDTLRIKQFLAALQEGAPTLFVGQQVDVPAAHHLTVDALTVGTTGALLSENDLQFGLAEVERLHRETGGNPRLLWLCINLLKEGESLANILAAGTEHAQPFEIYLNLLWQRLGATERRLLHALSVYPASAPRDPWPAGVLTQLQARHLVSYDQAGGVTLLPGVRTAMLGTLSAEQREELHRQAGALYAARADYTLAAYHFHHGAAPDIAVRLWYPHRRQEIARGQAATAEDIFHNISIDRLKKKDQQTLKIIRAELHQLIGNLTAGLDALGDLDGEDEADDLLLQAQRLEGDFLDALGAPEQALDAYADGLASLAQLQQQAVDLHVRRGMVNVRQRRLGDAWQAAQQARYQAEQLQGLICEEQGDLTAAERYYRTALEIATAIDDVRGLAETNRSLCNVYGRRGEGERAARHAAAAIAHYESMGDLVNVALVQSNLAAAYLDAGEFEQVVTVGTPAFEFFRQHGYAHRLAGTACNLAEAHYELGDLDAAQALAELALRQEEPLAAPYARYTQALVAEARQETEAALQLLTECRTIAQANEDIFIEAYAWSKRAELLATVDRAATERVEAARHAMSLFQRLGMEAMAAEAEQWA